jgi:hypothetical protein
MYPELQEVIELGSELGVVGLQMTEGVPEGREVLDLVSQGLEDLCRILGHVLLR